MDDLDEELDDARRLHQNGYEDSWENPSHVDYEFYHGSDHDHSSCSDSEAVWLIPAAIIVGLGITGVIVMRFIYY